MHFGSHSNDQVDRAAHAWIQPLGKIRVTSTVLVSGCYIVDVAGTYIVPAPFQWHLFGKQLELSHCCQRVGGQATLTKRENTQSVGDTSCDLCSNVRLYPIDYSYDKP